MRKAVLLVALLLLAAPPLAAQEWTAEQQEVIESINTFTETAYDGTADEFMAWIHPQFSGWDYSGKEPLDFAAMEGTAAEFFDYYDSVRLGAKPMLVSVLDDMAVVHTWYRERLTSPDGEEFMAGRWTIVLKKMDGEWKHLAWTWTQDRADPEKVKKEKPEG